MEISGAAALRRSPIFTAGRGRGFTDEGYLRYYVSPVRCGGRKKEEKRRAKIVKELSKDLSAFYSIGFGVEAGGAAAELKGKMMTEAADLLMSQLKQLKSEEKELKRKRKEQKAAIKAARMKDRNCDDSSSSSSSESSCSESETVVRMNNLMKTTIAEPHPEINMVSVAPESCCGAVLPRNSPVVTESCCGAVLPRNSPAVTESCCAAVLPRNSPVVTESCCAAVLQRNSPVVTESCSGAVLQRNSPVVTESCCGAVLQRNSPVVMESCSGAVLKSNPAAEIPMERIEVCMGGKCKRSGAIELMAEFEKLVGEGAVVGCKCMGKCKDGPNVRVSKPKGKEEGDVRVPRNPLCIGVGLEDVGAIVANFFGEEKKGAGLLAA